MDGVCHSLLSIVVCTETISSCLTLNETKQRPKTQSGDILLNALRLLWQLLRCTLQGDIIIFMSSEQQHSQRRRAIFPLLLLKHLHQWKGTERWSC